MPNVHVIAGPNGAGKSTAARKLLPEFVGIRYFVNADVIAQGLAAFAPEAVAQQAGRLMLQRLRELAEQRVDFAFETTLASRSFAPWLKSLQATGYFVNLIYLWIPSAEMAIARVRQRVSAGGHNVPEETIQRRYYRSLSNFLQVYSPWADKWELYDNTTAEPILIAECTRGANPTVLQSEQWQAICTVHADDAERNC